MNRSLLVGLGALVLTVGAPARAEHGGGHEDACCAAEGAEGHGPAMQREGREGGEMRRASRERGERNDREQEMSMSDHERMTRMMAIGAAYEQAQVIETVRMIQALGLNTEQGGRFAALMEEAQSAGREYMVNRRRLMMALAEKVRSNASDAEVSQALSDLRAADASHMEWERAHGDRVTELLGAQKTARFLLLRAGGPTVRVGGVQRNPNAAEGSDAAAPAQGARRSGTRRATSAPAAATPAAGSTGR